VLRVPQLVAGADGVGEGTGALSVPVWRRVCDAAGIATSLLQCDVTGTSFTVGDKTGR